jgi:hypothetical protein
MPLNINQNTARIMRAIPKAEANIDTALVSLASLMVTLIQARQECNVPSSAGQIAIVRLAKAQMSLVGVSSDMLRIHKEMLVVGKEHAGLDIHECREMAELKSVA